jgi:uncharacterized membrane protein YdbT with pleckstrin-like domain
MKYVEQVLQPGEKVIYATSLHWLVYLRSILLLILAIGCLAASAVIPEPTPALPFKIATALLILAVLFGVIALVSGLSAFIRRSTTELAVTDRRVIFKTGVFQRHSMEMNLSKVETVGVNQSILGRILGYGTVTVRGTGGSFEPVAFIGDPLTFRSTITAG